MIGTRWRALVAALGLVVFGWSAAPADHTPVVHDVVTFFARAEVCMDVSACPGGAGLQAPFLGPSPRTGAWRIRHVELDEGYSCYSLVALQCELDVAGQLGPVAGVGAACGISTGQNGQGTAQSTSTGDVVEVDNVGWAIQAGSYLIITGQYRHVSGAKSNPVRVGNLLGYADAQGAQGCAGAGATEFYVSGHFVLL